jgi:hypothetical protein
MFYSKIQIGMANLSTYIVSQSEDFNFKLFNKLKNYSRLIGFEAFVWICGLAYLAFFADPSQCHFTLCPLANLGIDFCPGCGLGHSITQIFRGDFTGSFHTHPLGFFALIVITYRIISLIKSNINQIKKAKA